MADSDSVNPQTNLDKIAESGMEDGFFRWWPAWKRIPRGWTNSGPAPGHHRRFSKLIVKL